MMRWWRRGTQRDVELEALVRMIDQLLNLVAEHTRLLTILVEHENTASKRQEVSAAELLALRWAGWLPPSTRAS
jgi:hypothetical protein